MTDQQSYLTEEGAADLRRELEDLKTTKRLELAAKLKEAISMGDLSENADYHDAKEQQAFLEGRISQLEEYLRVARVVVTEAADKNAKNTVVSVGMEVTIVEEGTSYPEIFTIVGTAEADPAHGRISNESPIGRALMGRKIKDKVTVEAPAGKTIFKITAIKRPS